MLLVVALLWGLAAVCAWYTLCVYREHRRFSGLPGPPRSSFFLGNLTALTAAVKRSTMEELLYQWHQQYGYVFVVFIFHKHIVSCIDPEVTKYVLIQHPRAFPKGSQFKYIGFVFGERSLGDGIATQTDYEKWALQRLALNPAFHKKYLISLVSDFNATASDLVDALRDFSGSGRPVDLCDWFHKATNDVISKLAFGKSQTDMRADSSLLVATKGMLKGFTASFFSAFPEWSPFIREERRDFRRHVRNIKAAATEAIRGRMEALKSNHDVPDDILSVMVKAHLDNPQFTMDLMLDNMVTFFVAGQETSANTLSFTFMELGRNPEVLKKAVDEVTRCIGERTFISYEDTCSLNYCTMVIKEILRIYPVVPGTSRYFSEAITLGGVSFPAGCNVKFSTFSSARHPDFFEDPEKFIPERFDPDREQRTPQTVYYPFSLGPRSCIGQNFAMIEMKIVLAKFLQRFDFHLDKSRPFVLGQAGTLHPKDGVWATLADR